MKIIAGPCQHESLQHSKLIISEAIEVTRSFNIEYYFKASFDKANRTHAKGIRGPGLEKTMKDFLRLKDIFPNLKILTDIHDVEQIKTITTKYNEAVDVLQIPAFLCRQTDLILAACDTDKIVNIKKGQFLAPWDVSGILSKTSNAKEVWITERGTSFGYNTLVVDYVGLQYMLETYDVPIVFDMTHSVQRPGGQGTSSGGNSQYAPGLGRAAAAIGVKNFFMEIHDNPQQAPSDGPNMINVADLWAVVSSLVNIGDKITLINQ